MQDTFILMKDGRTFCAPIWMFNEASCKEGWFSLYNAGEEVPDKIYFRETEIVITKNAIIGVQNKTSIYGDRDELLRARELGWDGN